MTNSRRPMTARYAGTCVECRTRFPAGADIHYARGEGAVCDRCWSKPVPAADPALIELGPDALQAEIDACCDALAPEHDGTPDEIFYRSERDGRRFDAYRKLLDTLVAEQAARARLWAAALQEATQG
jgi:hypothetical protein